MHATLRSRFISFPPPFVTAYKFGFFVQECTIEEDPEKARDRLLELTSPELLNSIRLEETLLGFLQVFDINVHHGLGVRFLPGKIGPGKVIWNLQKVRQEDVSEEGWRYCLLKMKWCKKDWPCIVDICWGDSTLLLNLLPEEKSLLGTDTAVCRSLSSSSARCRAWRDASTADYRWGGGRKRDTTDATGLGITDGAADTAAAAAAAAETDAGAAGTGTYIGFGVICTGLKTGWEDEDAELLDKDALAEAEAKLVVCSCWGAASELLRSSWWFGGNGTFGIRLFSLFVCPAPPTGLKSVLPWLAALSLL
uniref:Uncharacterized protein n=1 Tax=Chromera velia CCMP2878 TaxID=1169474 RepID=A0A0G4HC62_9ALVE|eukprot:Cvel_26125.t1-p1 / transcript=Cvel_26125.t1 / gene=Cvel_26125 / organism=Chromera_velia_CCMP2878 / gene_product=hypothetical protein / transcript_product=hypothetical protein / location=Cvel_scaffold3058:3046-11779(-) / protein_length=307 / sequence_SO=supercontig / SO=protein_coding / is_pseudo=false